MKECLCCCHQKEGLQTCTNVKCSYEICLACVLQLKKKEMCPHCQQPSNYNTTIQQPIPYQQSFYFWLWGYIFFMVIQGEHFVNVSLPPSQMSSHLLYGFIGDGIFLSIVLFGSVWYNPIIWHSLAY